MSEHREALREQMRQQFLTGLGGWTGMAIAAVPTVVFVVVNAVGDLRVAAICAVASSLLLAGIRLAMKKSPQQALSGLLGVVIAVFIAARTGQARGYFLLGIVTSFVYGAACLATIVARRPAAGLLWEFLDPSAPLDPPVRWYRRRELLTAYSYATGCAVAVFLARGAVQLALYHRDATGWLATARIVMGYPLTILAVLAAVWIVRRARKQLVDTSTDV